MGLVNKYPYTNFAGINLDYYIKMVNEVAGIHMEVVDTTIYLKDRSGNVISTCLLPDAQGFYYVEAYQAEDQYLFSMDVGEHLDMASNLGTTEMVLFNMVSSGRCMLKVINDVDYVIVNALINNSNGGYGFAVYDYTNENWKVWQLVQVNDKIRFTRVY